MNNVTVETSSSNNGWLIALCKSKPPFDDVRVRQALNLAVDKDELSEVFYGAKTPPVYGSWPPGHPF
jgi:ABC-type transport system substrate-binding protein